MTGDQFRSALAHRLVREGLEPVRGEMEERVVINEWAHEGSVEDAIYWLLIERAMQD